MASLIPFTRLRITPIARRELSALSRARLSSDAEIKTPPVKPYQLSLTPSSQYPVYKLWKRGGNMKLTKIRRIEGDIEALRKDLQAALKVDENEVTINPVTKHIIVKGHKKSEILAFLMENLSFPDSKKIDVTKPADV